ncbi:DUF6443 domain-containing protein [Flagellimonas algicola]|nr:DUF6443 domain-containing protein [Allomuricauda algicola]
MKHSIFLFSALVLTLLSQNDLNAQCYVENLSPSSFDFTEAGGTQTNSIVYTNGSCTYSLTFSNIPSWITSVTQPNSYQVVVTCQANQGGSRNALINYSYNGQMQSFAVSQDANPNPPPAPNIPTVVANSNGCGQATLQRSGNPPSGVTWYWQGTNSSGTSTSSSLNAANNNYTATQTGTYYIRARGGNGLWSPSASRAVSVIDLEPGVIENNNVSICSGDDPPQIDSFEEAYGSVGGHTYQWERSLNGGAWTEIGNANDSFYDPPAGLTLNAKYRRKASCGSQEVISNEATVTVDPLPGIASGNDVSRCGSGTLTLSATAGTNGNSIRWYSTSTGGTSLHTGINFGTPSLSATTSYYAESYNSTTGCTATSRKLIRAVINPIPGSATGNNTSRCGTGTVTLTANLGTNANTIRWYTASSGGTLLHTGTSFTTPSLSSTTTYFAESYNSTTGCVAGSRTPIQAQVESVITWYLDADGDGHAISTSQSCSSPGADFTQTVLPLDDCDDGNSGIQGPVVWYLDSDGDGLGDPNEPSDPSCTAPANHVADNTDQCPGYGSPTNQCEIPASNDPETHNYIYTRTYQSEVATVPTLKFGNDDAYVQQITFFDGLGRPQQQNAIRQSPDNKDVITHIGYDEYGRQDKEWLPLYEPLGSLGDFRTGNLEADTRGYYENHADYGLDFPTTSGIDVNAYSQKDFEPSPLNRVLKQAAPGEDWKLGNGHEIEFDYKSNSASDNVKQYRVSLVFASNTYTPTLVDDGTYTAKELYKHITYDENHDGSSSNLHTTEEFTDKQGRVVLKRTYAKVGSPSEVEAHDTYYVYDDFGNLTFVLPPLVDTSATIDQTILDNLCYQYAYDHRNRLVEKQLPGKEREFIIYNKLDQPVMTQDANLREGTGPDTWLFTHYDAHGRVAYTGKLTYANDTQRTYVQQQVDNYIQDQENNGVVDPKLWVNKRSLTDGPLTIAGSEVHYSGIEYTGATITEVLTVNYYDNYEFDTANEGASPTDVFNEPVDDRTQGLATGSLVKVLTTNDWITTVTRYDDKGRAIYTYSQNDYLQTTDMVESQLDFVGKPLKVRSQHTRNGNTVVTLDNFTYDHVGRLLSQTQCIGDQTLGESCDQVNVEANPVVNTSLVTQGTVGTQSVTIANPSPSEPVVVTGGTFRVDPNAGSSGADQELIVYNDYDELGQLKSKKVGGDPNASTLGLQTVDYGYNVRGWLKSINQDANADNDLFNFGINYNTVAHGGTALFNGNIAETQWETANDNIQRWYHYGYDALNRITGATSNTGNYDVANITYDKNGNIQTLNRDGWQDNGGGTVYPDMDILDYDYNAGNRLLKVTDTGNTNFGFKDPTTTGNDYRYDDNGNLVMDQNKGIGNDAVDGISYNHLNLPTSVVINGQTISYIYDAAGTKLRKNAEGSVTDYAGNYVYTDNNGTPVLEFLSHPEGYASPDGQGAYDYVYQYKDHLGNIRLSFMDNNGTTEIVEENNYYPFGLKHKGYNDTTSPLGNSVANRWKFGGKELDDSFNDALATYDFGARNYSPDLGRWMNVDPLADLLTQYDKSPYAYAWNNPIFFIDPDGESPCPPGIDCENPLPNMQRIRVNRASNLGAGYTRTNGTQWHAGHDLYAPVGTSVRSSMAGEVVAEGNSSSYGNYVTIKTTHTRTETVNGETTETTDTYYTFYAHLEETSVEEGDTVEAGDEIGTSGISGNASNLTGDNEHLHFEIGTELRSENSSFLKKDSLLDANKGYNGVSFASQDPEATNQSDKGVVKTQISIGYNPQTGKQYLILKRTNQNYSSSSANGTDEQPTYNILEIEQ